MPFALRLTNQENWGIPRRDFERILHLSPRGCFLACYGSTKLGIATTISYGKKLGWIGNVVVDRRYRERNIGRSLVQQATRYLHSSGVDHIGLYCFRENAKFYEKLGFVGDAEFLRLLRRNESTPRLVNPFDPDRPTSLGNVLYADKKALGADRSKLIRLLLAQKAAWYLGRSRTKTSTSYLMVKEYADMREIGPWVCINPHKGDPEEMLLKALTMTSDKPIEISCLRNNRRAVDVLKSHGFRTIREGFRMYFHDRARIGNDQHNFAIGFLDKG